MYDDVVKQSIILCVHLGYKTVPVNSNLWMRETRQWYPIPWLLFSSFWSSFALLEVHPSMSYSSFAIEKYHCICRLNRHTDSSWTTTLLRGPERSCHLAICRCRHRLLWTPFHSGSQYPREQCPGVNHRHFHCILKPEGCICCFPNQ